MERLTPKEFFDLNDVDHREVFDEDEPVWQTLDRLQDYLASQFDDPWPLRGVTGLVDRTLILVDGERRDDLVLRPRGQKGLAGAFYGEDLVEEAVIIMAGAYLFDDRLILGAGTVVESGAMLKGPLVAGEDTQLRQGAYVRGDCLVGRRCVVGHATEIKASVMLDGAQAGHFAYIGDSLLGRGVNLGAGTKLANLRMIEGNVTVAVERIHLDTGRRKLGAVVGDNTETGCNSVTSPGTLLGPRSVVYPTVHVPAGYYPGRTYFRPSRGSLQIMTGRS